MSKNSDFFIKNPIFTFREYKENFKENALATLRKEIWNSLKNGRIGAVGGGVYFVVPSDSDPDLYSPDRFLLASKLRKDAVIGYHSAFEILGYATQVFNTVYYITSVSKRRRIYREITCQSVHMQKTLESKPDFGIEKIVRSSVKIPVTNKERTFVDCLNNPEYSGGYEELLSCVEALPYLNLEFVFDYLSLLSKRSLFARAGFMLEKYRSKFFFDEKWEKKFIAERAKSHSIAYLENRREAGKLVKKWNLMVPEKYIKQETQNDSL